MELIDKQASMKAICDGCFKSRAVDIELKCRGTCNVIDILQQQPTIEPEVRHGRWILDHHGVVVCNLCRFPQQIGAKDFCGKCGAKMDAEDINVLAKDGGARNDT